MANDVVKKPNTVKIEFTVGIDFDLDNLESEIANIINSDIPEEAKKQIIIKLFNAAKNNETSNTEGVTDPEA